VALLLRAIGGAARTARTIRAELALGHPVVASEIDPYVDAGSVAYDDRLYARARRRI